MHARRRIIASLRLTFFSIINTFVCIPQGVGFAGWTTNPASILHKSIAGRYRPVRVADGPITARCRFIKNASWEGAILSQ